MGLFLGLILPIVVILAPVTVLILIGIRREKLSRSNFGVAIFLCLVAGCIVPILATHLSMYGLTYKATHDRPGCIPAGIIVFTFAGYFVNLFFVPVAGVVLFPEKNID